MREETGHAQKRDATPVHRWVGAEVRLEGDLGQDMPPPFGSGGATGKLPCVCA